MANMTSTSAPDQLHQDFNDLMNNLHNFNPLTGNVQLLSALVRFNVMWSAVFLIGFYLLWDLVSHYIPIVKRVPVLPSLFSLVWFISCLLIVVLVYTSSDSKIVKGFGVLFIILLFLSFLLTFYRFGSIALMLYHHRSFAVALRGPTVVCINSTCFSAASLPLTVTIVQENGKVTYEGNDLGNVDPTKLTVHVFEGRTKTSFETHRNSFTNKLVKAFDRKFYLTTYCPLQDEATAKSLEAPVTMKYKQMV